MTERTQNYLTVSALSKYISQKFDRDPHLQKLQVIGEISNFRPRPKGPQFFALKEGQVVINAVMFPDKYQRLKFQLEEGMKVIVTARVGVYEAAGRYQLYIESIEPDGVGALYLALEQLKERMKQAGLFDRPKKELAKFPKRIAVITSPTGAVIRDILTTINRRFPIVEVIVFPTRVQGQEAVREVVKAFEMIANFPEKIDGVILARGGGSIEDLWCFNDELIAQAILDCNIPVISSIGHETDTTISDLVADLRAPTPTAAAELSVPVLQELVMEIEQKTQRMRQSLYQYLRHKSQLLDRYRQSYVLTQPQRLYESYVQSLNWLTDKLVVQTNKRFQEEYYRLDHLDQRLRYSQPIQQIKMKEQKLAHIQSQLLKLLPEYLQNSRQQLDKNLALLDAYSPLKIMQRGYTLVEREQMIIKSSQELTPNDHIKVRFIDGLVKAEVLQVDPLNNIDYEEEN
ncbi:exodeoxyribonuclease VII large subunit [Facklamia sp. DSM 111018]|uniref:Exodeoxyribonuclease 7 large subunit n=1 Tax=Facklamia lactis TaxID=2749967 RepID=A0ABS0LR81_9LACT|nr:exodeoxyribonuclease VII large subunit [Facklamia lactis]MBG9980979.1 exodeoxyribonuclease VII large subunit [Facklamia lactis]MBG9986658.1 exodeoxyribonuclease VII large subunit [Facklamia lactis]